MTKDEIKPGQIHNPNKDNHIEYEPTEKELEVVKTTFEIFRDAVEVRNRSYENFDGLNLIQYIEDSYRRTTTNVDVREDIEEWQSTIHDPFTRNKVNAILGKMVSVLPGVETQNRGDDDFRKADILTNLYEFAEEQEDYEEFIVEFLFESIVKGTAIGYEGHEYKERPIRDIVSGTDTEIKVVEKKEITNRLISKIIRLEDFYPSTIHARSVKEIPHAFVRDVQPYHKFKADYRQFPKHINVSPKRNVGGEAENKPYYLDYISEDVQEGSVEVLYFYDKANDQFVIIANGVWLNPIKVSEEEEVVCPIPFKHKELPFFDLRFELFEPNFFYGKSLPDKLKNLQDVLNVLTNMLMDQSFLSIFAPILTNGADSIEDDYLVPGRRSPIETNGLPINQAVMKLDMGTPSGWHQYILEHTRKVMEEASMDRVSQGIAGQGDRTTAQEVRVAAEGVAAMLGLFGRFVKTCIKRKAKLKVQNIMQFWTDPRYPVVEQVLGVGGMADAKKIFNTFKIKNAVLTNGKRGMRVIDMYMNPSDRPTKKELEAKAMISKAVNNREVEYVALDPSYIRNVDIDIKLVPNSKSESIKDLEKALHLEKVRMYKEMFPGMTDDMELFAQTAEKFGDDPAKIINKNLSEGQQTQPTDGAGGPQVNVANNAVRSMAGGEGQANSLVALQNEMLG